MKKIALGAVLGTLAAGVCIAVDIGGCRQALYGFFQYLYILVEARHWK